MFGFDTGSFVGPMLAHVRPNIGSLSVQCWLMVGQMLTHGRPNIGSWSAQYWLMVGPMLVDGRPNVGSWSAQCWFMVGPMLTHGRSNVGSWSAQCWLMVGSILGQPWANIGPTKTSVLNPNMGQYWLPILVQWCCQHWVIIWPNNAVGWWVVKYWAQSHQFCFVYPEI